MEPRALQRADEPQIGGSRVVPLFSVTARSVIYTPKPSVGTFLFASFQLTANRAGDPQLNIVLTAAKWGRDLPSIPPQNYKKGG